MSVVAKGFLFELSMKQAAERGYKLGPGGKSEPWTDDDHTQLNALGEFWRIGRLLRNAIVEKHAGGQPFDKEEGLLRYVHASCRAWLQAWQPTDRQRQRSM